MFKKICFLLCLSGTLSFAVTVLCNVFLFGTIITSLNHKIAFFAIVLIISFVSMIIGHELGYAVGNKELKEIKE